MLPWEKLVKSSTQPQQNNTKRQTCLSFMMTWLTNYTHSFLWDVISHLRLEFDGGSIKWPLKLQYGWVITFYHFMTMSFFYLFLASMRVQLAFYKKRPLKCSYIAYHAWYIWDISCHCSCAVLCNGIDMFGCMYHVAIAGTTPPGAHALS